MKKDIILRNLFYNLILIVLAIIVYFFLGIGFDNINLSLRLIISVCFFALMFLANKKGLPHLILTLLTWSSIFISLAVSFSNPYTGDALIHLNLVLSPLIIFIISTILSLIILFAYQKMSYKNKFPLLLLLVYILIWIILAFNTKYFDDWKLENYLTVPFIILIYFTHRWFKFSNLSYVFIFLFMTLHIFGSHYTYAEVPFGFWLSGLLDVSRNHYDRIVHFSFGFLLAYPIRELFMRIAKVKGIWAFYIPIELVLAFSCIYELIEWGSVILFGGDLGVAYLGTQGDIWDAQKDMALAGLGSLIAMLITFFTISILNKNFWKELKESFKIKKNDKPLGEIKISELLKRKK